ncbi:hypothetical protein [Pseudokineococcus sp. 1T1Z-3]|uniref:hypothetical protein n=1 Tax=Pseudokineococcus sp. 1T1Z-3 TaxID=3132745 RepID=UPI0030A52B4F
MDRRGAPPQAAHDQLEDVLHALAEVEGCLGREVAAHVVAELEALAGRSLGDTAGDPLVVLQRRGARAAARLQGLPRPVEGTGAPGPAAAALAVMAGDLRDPSGALLRRLDVGTVEDRAGRPDTLVRAVEEG